MLNDEDFKALINKSEALLKESDLEFSDNYQNISYSAEVSPKGDISKGGV